MDEKLAKVLYGRQMKQFSEPVDLAGRVCQLSLSRELMSATQQASLKLTDEQRDLVKRKRC